MPGKENETDEADGGELFHRLYDELRRIAGAQMKREASSHTLQPTALINEAYLKVMSGGATKKWQNDKHFLCVAASAMRQILVDSARARATKKRGNNPIKIELTDFAAATFNSTEDIISVNDALRKLEQISPEKSQLINLRLFAGLSIDEAAKALDISRSTAYKYWNFGKTWLYLQLKN